MIKVIVKRINAFNGRILDADWTYIGKIGKVIEEREKDKQIRVEFEDCGHIRYRYGNRVWFDYNEVEEFGK